MPAVVLVAVGVILWIFAFRDSDRIPEAVRDFYIQQEAPALTYKGFLLVLIGTACFGVGMLSGIGWWVRVTMPRFLEERRRERDHLVEARDRDTAARVRARREELGELDERFRERESLLELNPTQLAAIREELSTTLDSHDREGWLSRQGEMWVSGVIGAFLGYLVSSFVPLIGNAAQK